MPDTAPGTRPGALHALLRWIGRHVRGFHAAVGTFLTLGFLLALAAAAAFGWIAEEVGEGETLRTDDALMYALRGVHSARLDFTMLEVTALGSGAVVLLIALIAGLFLWLTRHHYSAVLLWTAVVGSGALNTILKHLFHRPRPELFPWVTHAASTSFPSGHAMNAVATYGTLAYLVGRLQPTARLRRLVWVIAVLLILAIGVSRPYLGVHYPSDVLAGYLAGGIWAVACALGIEAVRFFRERRPGLERVEHDLDAVPVAGPRPPRAVRG